MIKIFYILRSTIHFTITCTFHLTYFLTECLPTQTTTAVYTSCTVHNSMNFTHCLTSTAPLVMQLHTLKCNGLRVCRNGQNRMFKNKLCTVRRTQMLVIYKHLHVSVVNWTINRLLENQVQCTTYIHIHHTISLCDIPQVYSVYCNMTL